MSALPLAGLRILEIASLYAAPYAGTILADFGADVVKVEPPQGDGFRNTRMWPLVARNKRSAVIDLRSAEGCETLRRLSIGVDVIIENFPASILKSRGIDWATLSAINPRLVMLSVSCFGQTGPYATFPGSGTIGEGFGGLTHLIGTDGGSPMLPSVALGDAVGAMSSVIGLMTAIYWRDHGGHGQQVDASLYEPILQVIAQSTARWTDGTSPKRSGSKMPGGSIRNVFITSDGEHVVISASTSRHFNDLLTLAGGTSESHDPDSVVAHFIAQHSLVSILSRLNEARVPVATVNDIDAILADPHVNARQSMLRMKDSTLGELAVVAPTPRLVTTPGTIRSLGPSLGEDTDLVMKEWAKPAGHQ